MRALGIVLSVLLILGILLDAFEVVVLPRRVMRRMRFARAFYRITWIPTAAFARRIRWGRISRLAEAAPATSKGEREPS
jgi:hypothetical protein